MSAIKEFKEFAFKGNLIDMAVGLIIGGAFGTLMKSLVDDIFMPCLGLFNGVDFKETYLVLKGKEGVTEGMTVAAAKETGAVLMTYGNFISSVIAFLIVVLAIFIVIVKVMGSMKKEEEPEPDPEPTNEEKMLILLSQIRDKIA